MLTSKFLKGIMTEAYPVIKRQVEDAKIVSGFRDTVAANGGDWSALKALIKAHVEDTLDEEGGNKRVQKILDKADSSNAYAGMLGLIMNEKNFIADDEEFDPSTGEITPKQSAPQAARDLATSPSPQSQVATHYLKASTGDAQFRDPLDWEDEDGALPIQSHRAETPEGQRESALCDKADMTGKTAGADAPAAPDNTIIFKAKPLRPNCLKPEACAGQGRNHCWPCRKAMAEEGAA